MNKMPSIIFSEFFGFFLLCLVMYMGISLAWKLIKLMDKCRDNPKEEQ